MPIKERDFELELEDPQWMALRREADRRGVSLDGLIQALALKESTRILGWERTYQPQPKLPSRSVGRPVEDAVDRRIKRVAEHLGNIYLQLRNLYPQTFEETYGLGEREWHRMARERDVVGLEEFEQNQPWIRK